MCMLTMPFTFFCQLSRRLDYQRFSRISLIQVTWAAQHKRKNIFMSGRRKTTNTSEPEAASVDQKSDMSPSFPVVGIGASAGGLHAFQAFFFGMPKEPELDIAIVLIQHLPPDHKSLLTELIQEYSPLPVQEVKNGMRLKPNLNLIMCTSFRQTAT